MPDLKPIVDQHTIIMRNVRRWQQEQAAKAAKRAKLALRAHEAGLEPKQFLQLQREQVLLKSGRATIESIMRVHGVKVIK